MRDEKVLDEIIAAADLTVDDLVLEIGPGEGVLTKELLKLAGKIIAIEKDDNLVLRLEALFRGNEKLEIIHADIMEINLPEILRLRPGTDFAQDDEFKYKLIANIPYYITSPIIRLFLETKYPPRTMILMVQKEVAERICASAGQMSILAVSVQYYATAKILFEVDRKSFWPVPEVDSAIIRIVPTRKNIFKEERKNFFRLVKAGFSAKRKTLSNNLATSLQLDKKIVEEKLAQAGLLPSVRAQELSVENWEKLRKLFEL